MSDFKLFTMSEFECETYQFRSNIFETWQKNECRI